MKRKNIKKYFAFVVLIAMVISLTACGNKKESIQGTYVSEDESTMIVCDRDAMFVLTGEDDEKIMAGHYTIENDLLTFGNSKFEFQRQEKNRFKIGNENYTKKTTPLSVRWRLVKWSSKSRIQTAKLGIFQWLILDQIFMEGKNIIGNYSITGGRIAIACILLFGALIYFIFHRKKKN